MKKLVMEKKLVIEKKLLLLGAVLAVMPVFLFSSLDAQFITYWAVELLDHIHSGELYSYAADMMAKGLASGINYSLWLDAAFALWELPLYLVHCLFHLPAHWVIYEVWAKILVWIVNIAASLEIIRIFSLLGKKKEEAIAGGYLYLISAVVCLYGAGYGQVDGFGVWLLLISIRFMLGGQKPEKAAIFAGLSILCKSFSLMVIGLLFLLYAKPNRKTVKCTFIVIFIQVLEKVTSLMLVKDYFAAANRYNREMFFPRLLEVSVNDYPIFPVIALIICAICLYKNISGTVAKTDWIFASAWMFCAFFFLIYWHNQWFMYAVMEMLLVIAVCRQKFFSYLLYLGMNTGFLMYLIPKTEEFVLCDFLKVPTVLGRLMGIHEEISIGMYYPIPIYTYSIGRILLLACFIMLNLLPFLEMKQKEGRAVTAKMEKWLLALQWLPTAGYILFSWAVYL